VELLTLKQIAQRLEMAPSTVKYYRDKHADFMPGVKAGRYVKYEPEAIEIIQIIADGIKNNLQQQHINEMLSAKFALNIEQTDLRTTTTTTATTEQQQTDISSKENHKALAQANKEIMRLSSIIDRLLDDNRELTRRLLQLPAPARASLWQRIFNPGRETGKN
jgi:DNA-binding transcriptional MerR regulator